MSIDAVVSRIQQLQQQLIAATVAPGGNDGSDFASQLMNASSSAASAAGATSSGYGLSGLSSATGAGLPAGVPYGAEISAAARRNGIDPALLAGLVKQESGFNPTAGSPAGARGLTQLMPATAASLGVTDV